MGEAVRARGKGRQGQEKGFENGAGRRPLAIAVAAPPAIGRAHAKDNGMDERSEEILTLPHPDPLPPAVRAGEGNIATASGRSTPSSAVSHGESESVSWNETKREPNATESRALEAQGQPSVSIVNR